MDKTIRNRLQAVEQKNIQMAERILSEAKTVLVNKKFDEKRINSFYKKKKSPQPRTSLTG